MRLCKQCILINFVFNLFQCYVDDNGNFLNYAHNHCVTDCASGEYVDSTTHTCTKCYTPMPNC